MIENMSRNLQSRLHNTKITLFDENVYRRWRSRQAIPPVDRGLLTRKIF